MNRERAIQQGIDSARVYRKEGPWPYPQLHPLFHYFWNAVVEYSDTPTLSDKQVRERVMRQLEHKSGRAETVGAM